MPKLLFPETHEHGPAEYHFSAEEIAEMATWDEIGDWLVDNVGVSNVTNELIDMYIHACAEYDDDARERIQHWLTQGVAEGYKELLFHIWKHDKSFFDDDIEAWAKEQESAQ